MSKWLVRFWGFVALGALIGLVASSAWSREEEKRYPPVTPNEELAQSAMRVFTGASNEEEAQKRLGPVHERLRLAAQAEPDALRVAHVLLRRGLNPAEVGSLLDRHSLGFASLEARVPLPDGNVMTMGSAQFGPYPLMPGTTTEQVERNLGRMRMNFLRRSQAEGDTAQGRASRGIALSRELGVYRVEVWGAQRSLARLLDEPDVRGVLADDSSELGDSYEQKSREVESRPIVRGPTIRIVIPEDPNVPLPELPPDTLEPEASSETPAVRSSR